MILIFSEADDYSSSKVIKWLRFRKQNFVRINQGDQLELNKLRLGKSNSFQIYHNKKTIPIAAIQAYWYRRGSFGFKPKYDLPTKLTIPEAMTDCLKEELAVVDVYLKKLLQAKKNIGNLDKRRINKLVALRIAEDCGLLIPDTIICTSKKELQLFLAEHQEIICKPIYEALTLDGDNQSLKVLTQTFTTADLEKVEDEFFPSLFQKRISKKYELRIFYLNGNCYANAIFSQLDNKTAVDVRNYNFNRANRRVPFRVSNALKLKLTRFMKAMDLKSGSIDMIVTPTQEYVFLEVNSVGQFGMTSYTGNYNIEKEIADYLAKP